MAWSAAARAKAHHGGHRKATHHAAHGKGAGHHRAATAGHGSHGKAVTKLGVWNQAEVLKAFGGSIGYA